MLETNRSTRRTTLALAAVGLLACGGDAEVETTETETETTTGAETTRPREDGMAISGLMGTISADEVRNTIEPKLSRFFRCFQHRYDDIEILGGHIHLSFRIDVEGNVLWVYPNESSIGDRETERCLVETAAAIHFPRPHGGEAEFGYPLDLDPPEDVRPPVHWEESSIADVLEDKRGELVAQCGGGYSVTMYVGPGGEVMASGAAADELDQAENLDCVASAVREWAMPDPGSYPAKVTFTL